MMVGMIGAVSVSLLSAMYLSWVADYIAWLRYGSLVFTGGILCMVVATIFCSEYRQILRWITIACAALGIVFAALLFKQPVWGGYGFLIGAIKHGLRAPHWTSCSQKLSYIRSFLSIDLKERLQLLCGYQAPCCVCVSGHTIHFKGFIETKHEFSEIFLRGDYGIDYPAQEPVIIDCGAHIGLATLFFKLRYPDAKITAFEPDPTNFALLKGNVGLFDDIELVNKALFDEEGELAFQSDRQSMSKLSEVETSENVIRVATTRLSSYIDGPVDIVKMDIEGAETQVIHELAAAGKLRDIKNLVMEFHYSKKDQNSLGDVLNEFAEQDFNIEIRENMRLGAMFERKQYSIPMTLLVFAYHD